MTKWCFSHTDSDGIASAAVIKYFVPEAQIRLINYGDNFPWHEVGADDIVYMADFSLQPWSEMEKLHHQCKRLIWLDHHISAIKDCDKSGVKIAGKREVGVGACMLCWEYLWAENNPDQMVYDTPYAVTLLSDYDVWDHSNPDTLPFQYGFRNLHPDPSDDKSFNRFWMPVLDQTALGHLMVKELISSGKIILKYVEQDYKKCANWMAFETEIDGYRAIAINRAGVNSLLFNSVFDPKRYDCMIAFAWVGDHWTVSLYGHDGGPDVSVIAKGRGGGGHRAAAGFQIYNNNNELPFKPVQQ